MPCACRRSRRTRGGATLPPRLIIRRESCGRALPIGSRAPPCRSSLIGLLGRPLACAEQSARCSRGARSRPGNGLRPEGKWPPCWPRSRYRAGGRASGDPAGRGAAAAGPRAGRGRRGRVKDAAGGAAGPARSSAVGGGGGPQQRPGRGGRRLPSPAQRPGGRRMLSAAACPAGAAGQGAPRGCARTPTPRARAAAGPSRALPGRRRTMAWVLKMDEVIESGLVHDFDASLSGIGQELGAGAYSMSDVLALPIFKQEDSNLPPENETKHPPFQYVMCAATSPAVKLHDETLTYLNQGQSYEIRMLDNRKAGDMPEITGKLVKSIIRVVFHDRRLQYTEHQQLEGWKWNRPGDRLLDLDIPMSIGVIDIKTNPSQLNAVEFLWDPAKRTSAFIQVHCISTEFTPRKHGGEKGVPFRIQVDTFKQTENGEYTDHLHSASCQIKVFKPKGADRKQKTDREKMEKRTAHEKEKYQPSYDTTILTECSPWPDTPTAFVNNTSTPAPTFTSAQHSSTYSVPDSNSSSPNHQGDGSSQGTGDQLLPSATIQETQQWLLKHRFSTYTRLFSNFSGADLLKLTREDLVQICGPADGIRLYNALKSRSVRPRLTIYVCQEPARSIQLERQQDAGSSDNSNGAIYVYHAIYLEEMAASEVTRKLALVFNIPLHQINQVYRQGPTGIHILVSDQMVQNFQDESCFLVTIIKAENGEGFHIILK